MLNKLSSNLWILVGSSLIASCSCSGDKPQAKPAKPMQEEKMQMQEKSSDQDGPQQAPFQHCDAMDSECEEGAALDLFEKGPASAGEEKAAVVDSQPAAEEKQEQALFVTPIVIEAVKIQMPAEESSSIAQETPKQEAPAARAEETASASSPEPTVSAE